MQWFTQEIAVNFVFFYKKVLSVLFFYVLLQCLMDFGPYIYMC